MINIAIFLGIILPFLLLWGIGKLLTRGLSEEENTSVYVEVKTEEDIMKEKEEKRLKRKRIREQLEQQEKHQQIIKQEKEMRILDNPVDIVNLDKPRSFDEFTDSSNIKKEILKKIKSANSKNEPLRHMIFWGVPGTGKSTMAELIAKKMKVNIYEIAPKNIKEPQDLLSVFQKLNKTTQGQGDIILMDEIDMMKSDISELFNKTLTHYQMAIHLPDGKPIKSNLPLFTLIGTTNRLSKLLNSLKSRCEMLHFQPYKRKDIEVIISNLANRYKLKITDNGIELLAKISQNIPRNAVILYKNARDIANDIIDVKIIKKIMKIKGIDKWGLTSEQRKELEAIKKSSKGKLSLTNVSSTIQVERNTVQEDIEPFLVKEGFIEIGSGGRILTEKGEKTL